VTVQTFYRCSVLLPLIAPALIMIAKEGFGIRPSMLPFGEVLLLSGIYGAVPYAVIALWGLWWIDSRPERQIRRRALQAPLWMLVAWIVCAAILGVLSRQLAVFLGLAGLGAVMILTLGYGYVGAVLLLRKWLDLSDATPARGPEA
jgi:hypothetical protein